MDADMQMIFLYASPYRMLNESGEVTNSGLTVYAYGKSNLKPRKRMRGSNESFGSKPIKLNLPLELAEKIKEVPGLYECEIDFEGKSDMKNNVELRAQLNILDLDFVGTLETKLITPQAPPAK